MISPVWYNTMQYVIVEVDRVVLAARAVRKQTT